MHKVSSSIFLFGIVLFANQNSIHAESASSLDALIESINISHQKKMITWEKIYADKIQAKPEKQATFSKCCDIDKALWYLVIMLPMEKFKDASIRFGASVSGQEEVSVYLGDQKTPFSFSRDLFNYQGDSLTLQEAIRLLVNNRSSSQCPHVYDFYA